MITATTQVKVQCDSCGRTVFVGDDGIEFDASDAVTPEEGAWMTLTEHFGWTYNIDDDEVFCPVCSFGNVDEDDQ